MNKQKLIELRCKAWGITEAEYFCNQCSDFSLEDMARAYRRGKNKGASDKAIQNVGFYQKQMQDIYDKKNKQITDLEGKISVLLSCKNCPENKGGLICSKEYENKCLAQKIEFIKELQEENKELTLKISGLESDCDAYDYSQRTYQEEIKELKAENEQIKNSDTLCKLIGEQKRKITELEAQIEKMKCCGNCVHFDFTEPNYCHKGVYRANQNVCGEWCFGN